jgi:hypothetical protein
MKSKGAIWCNIILIGLFIAFPEHWQDDGDMWGLLNLLCLPWLLVITGA